MCHKHESFELPNARDCEHGRQIGKCPECEVVQLERELADAKAELAKLTECVKAGDMLRGLLGPFDWAGVRYDAARKDIKL